MKPKEYLDSEIKKISGLSAGNRLRYIAEYYRVWIAGIVFAAVFACWFFYRMFFAVKENWFSLTIVNIVDTQNTAQNIRDEFAAFAGYDLDEKNVNVNTSSYFNASIPGGTNNTYYEAFAAAVETGELDAVIMEEENLVAAGAAGWFMDLSAAEWKDLFAPYADYFVYTVPYDETYSTGEVPVGIDISGTPFAQAYHFYEDSCVLGVGAHSEHPEAVIQFLRFMGMDTGKAG